MAKKPRAVFFFLSTSLRSSSGTRTHTLVMPLRESSQPRGSMLSVQIDARVSVRHELYNLATLANLFVATSIKHADVISIALTPRHSLHASISPAAVWLGFAIRGMRNAQFG